MGLEVNKYPFLIISKFIDFNHMIEEKQSNNNLRTYLDTRMSDGHEKLRKSVPPPLRTCI